MSDSCYLIDCSLQDSSVHGILQARILAKLPFLLQKIFLTQGLNPLGSSALQADSLLTELQEKPFRV